MLMIILSTNSINTNKQILLKEIYPGLFFQLRQMYGTKVLF